MLCFAFGFDVLFCCDLICPAVAWGLLWFDVIRLLCFAFALLWFCFVRFRFVFVLLCCCWLCFVFVLFCFVLCWVVLFCSMSFL